MGLDTINNIRDAVLPVFEKYKNKVIFGYLFGSAAQKTGYPSRDVDIAVFLSGDGKKSAFDVKLSLYADFCRALKRNDVDVVVLNIAVNLMLLDEIVRYGVVLYDADPKAREEFELKIQHQAIDFKNQRLAIMGV